MKCTTCGYEIADNAEICENCGRPQRRTRPAARENVILGVLGALVGAALGVAAYIALSQMNIFAAFCGLLLALLTLWGYRAFGRRVGAFGWVFCSILLLVVPFAADWVDWALVLMRQSPEYGLAAAVLEIPHLLADGSIAAVGYANNLGLLYGFTLLGVVIFALINAAANRRSAPASGRRRRH